MIYNTSIYNMRENCLSHGHNDITFALEITCFLSQTTVNIVFYVADKSNNSANYDTSMTLSGHVQLMFLNKLSELVIKEFNMASIYFKIARIV